MSVILPDALLKTDTPSHLSISQTLVSRMVRKIATQLAINTQGALKIVIMWVVFFLFVCGHYALLEHIVFNHSIFTLLLRKCFL